MEHGWKHGISMEQRLPAKPTQTVTSSINTRLLTSFAPPTAISMQRNGQRAPFRRALPRSSTKTGPPAVLLSLPDRWRHLRPAAADQSAAERMRTEPSRRRGKRCGTTSRVVWV